MWTVLVKTRVLVRDAFTKRNTLDVPRELVAFVSSLPHAHRRVLGTRKETRILTTWRPAVFCFVWFRNGDVDIPQLRRARACPGRGRPT